MKQYGVLGTTSYLANAFREAGINLFETELHEREAFKALFAFNQPLSHLDPKDVSNVDKAVANAEAYATEVIELLRRASKPQEAA